MIRSLTSLLLLVSMTVAAQKLKVRLKPAQSALQNSSSDRLFFAMEDPVSLDQGCFCSNSNSTLDCEMVCGGFFKADLSEYQSMTFEIHADEGTEIFVRHKDGDPRVRAEFSAEAMNCTDVDTLLLDKKVKNAKVQVSGSDTLALENAFVQDDSFLMISNCKIWTRLEFRSRDEISSFGGKLSELKWSVSWEGQPIKDIAEHEYFFRTDGSAWIDTQFEGAIVDAPAIENNGPNSTVVPSSNTTDNPVDSSSNTTDSPVVLALPSASPVQTLSPATDSPTKVPSTSPTRLPPTSSGYCAPVFVSILGSMVVSLY